jgi:SOS-response transcriptional repressor LexA
MAMKWYDFAKSLMRNQSINQEKLAEHMGITKGAVSHWLNGRREPSLGEIAKILQYLGKQKFSVGAGGLIIIDGDVENASSCRVRAKYPVISHVTAASWNTATEAQLQKVANQWLESNAHIRGTAFWLQVDGDSMAAPTGLTIAEGTFVLFDTGHIPVNGSLVIAKPSESDGVTFKKLVIDGGMKYLKALNPQWPLIPIDRNCPIIGVAIETKIFLGTTSVP